MVYIGPVVEELVKLINPFYGLTQGSYEFIAAWPAMRNTVNVKMLVLVRAFWLIFHAVTGILYYHDPIWLLVGIPLHVVLNMWAIPAPKK